MVAGYSPTSPSTASRRKSAWPLWRIPEAVIATHMRAQAAQGPAATSRTVEPATAAQEPQQTKMARLAARVTGRGGAQEGAER
jgi:hypothetical protein